MFEGLHSTCVVSPFIVMLVGLATFDKSVHYQAKGNHKNYFCQLDVFLTCEKYKIEKIPLPRKNLLGKFVNLFFQNAEKNARNEKMEWHD